MLITAMTVENFKGISDPVRIEFKPITLLFGPNSSGKSTIIQALHYAHEIFERENLDPGETLIGGKSINLGGFKSLVNNHDIDKEISLRFDMKFADFGIDQLIYDTTYLEGLRIDWEAEHMFLNGYVEIKIKWSHILNRPIISCYEVGGDSLVIGENVKSISRITCSEDGKRIMVSYIDADHIAFRGINPDDESSNTFKPAMYNIIEDSYLGDGTNVNFVLTQKSALPMSKKWLDFEGVIFDERIEDEYKDDYFSFVGQMSEIFVLPAQYLRDILKQFIYLGPLREVPERNYEPPKTPDKSRWASGIGAWDDLSGATIQFIDDVNKWLDYRIESGYRVKIKRVKELDIFSPAFLMINKENLLDEFDRLAAEIVKLPEKKTVCLEEVNTGIEVMPYDVGVGISQVLPVIVLALKWPNKMIAIEQPELHIHPRFQVELGDLFISKVLVGKVKEFGESVVHSASAMERDCPIILETHSEHLLLRLLRRIRETHEGDIPPGVDKLTNEQLAIYYLENTAQGAKIYKLEVDETGDSKGRWPEGFFEERHKELF